MSEWGRENLWIRRRRRNNVSSTYGFKTGKINIHSIYHVWATDATKKKKTLTNILDIWKTSQIKKVRIKSDSTKDKSSFTTIKNIKVKNWLMFFLFPFILDLKISQINWIKSQFYHFTQNFYFPFDKLTFNLKILTESFSIFVSKFPNKLKKFGTTNWRFDPDLNEDYGK